MIRGKLVVDGVLYKWLPTYLVTESLSGRTSEATINMKGLQHAVAARSGRRFTGVMVSMAWSGKTYMSQTLHDHFLALYTLGRPFYLQHDDELSSEGETLAKLEGGQYLFSSRKVKPATWTPVSRVGWDNCIFIDGVAVSTADFTIEESEGSVTFDTPPTGVVTAKFVAVLPVAFAPDGFGLNAVTQAMAYECDGRIAYQGTVKLLEVADALEAWPVYTGCLSKPVIDSLHSGGNDDDLWQEIIEPPTPVIRRRTKTINPTATDKVQPSCGNGTSSFEFTWPSLALPYNAHLLKATLNATLAEDTGDDFWIAPMSQDIDGLTIVPNDEESAYTAKKIAEVLSELFTTDRLGTYISPYTSADVLDWRWLAGALNSTETFDSINPAVPILPTSDGFLNYIEATPSAEMEALMDAAVLATNYDIIGSGVTGSGKTVWIGGGADATLETLYDPSPYSVEYRVWPQYTLPGSPPTPIEWINQYAKVSGSLKLKIRWKRGHDLGKLNKVKVAYTLNVMAQSSCYLPAYWATISGSSRLASVRLGKRRQLLERGVDKDTGVFVGTSVTSQAFLTEDFEEWVTLSPETQIGTCAPVSVLADAQALSGTDSATSAPGQVDAQASVYMELTSISCGGQKIDLDDVEIVAEWIPLSNWQITPDANGEYGGLNAGVWTQGGDVVLGDPEDPEVNGTVGDGFNGGFVSAPAATGEPGVLFRSMDHILRELQPLHGADKVTGVRVRLQAKLDTGTGSVCAAVLPENDFTPVSSWTAAQAFAATTAWQTFEFDEPYTSLIHGEFITVADLATCMFGIFASSAFSVRNIVVSVYYIHEDV